MSSELDQLQNSRIDNIEARLTALETIIIEVRANAKMLKLMALGLLTLVGVNVQDFVM